MNSRINTEKFGYRLKELRNEKEMTQEELAAILKLGRTAIANYETGRTSPDVQTLAKLAIIFRTSTDYLLGLTDVKNNNELIEKTQIIHNLLNETNELLLQAQTNIKQLEKIFKD